NRTPERARSAGAGPVREEDVQRLGGAEAVDDVLAEALLPRAEDRLGQHLARRQEPAQAGDGLRRETLRVIEERAVGRGDGEEERRSLLDKELPRPRRRERLRREHDRRARGEREIEARAEAVGEEELRRRVGDVVRADVEYVPSVARDRMRDAPLQVDDALRSSRRPRAVEPEGG